MDGPQFVPELERHRREVELHCYRMMGSVHDAEDLTQETFLRAWQHLDRFRGDASVRTWLYRIATNVCLDELRRKRRRIMPMDTGDAWDPDGEMPAESPENLWLSPFPDRPEDRAVNAETVSFAFLSVIQRLSPRQRAILILHDVLDWRASEIAEWLSLTEAATNSVLHRARNAIRELRDGSAEDPPSETAARSESPAADDARVLSRYLAAWNSRNPGEFATILRDDVTLQMPPYPSWYFGREAVMRLLAHPLIVGYHAGWHLVTTSANGLPGWFLYRAERSDGPYLPFGVMLVEIDRGAVRGLSIFKDSSLYGSFGLPPRIAPGS